MFVKVIAREFLDNSRIILISNVEIKEYTNCFNVFRLIDSRPVYFFFATIKFNFTKYSYIHIRNEYCFF